MLSQWRVARTLVIFLLSILVILFVAARLFILSSFEDLERQLIQSQVVRVHGALLERLNALSSKTGAWATWDESYAYVAGTNPQFLDRQATDAGFAQLEINLIVFMRPSGVVVHCRTFDLESKQQTPCIDSYKIQLDDFLKTLNPDSKLSGIILLPEHSMLITARPMLKSDGSGPVQGVLVFGRYLDNSEVVQIGATSNLPTEAFRLDQDLTQELKTAMGSLSLNNSQVVRPLNDNTIVGYDLLADIYGKPAMLLRIQQPRDMYQQGWTSIIYFLRAISLIAGVFALLVYVMGRRLVDSQTKARESEQLYHALANAAPDAIYIVDDKQRVKYANETAQYDYQNHWEGIIGKLGPRISPDEPGHEVQSVLESHKPLQFERLLHSPEGDTWLDVKMVPLRSEDGALDSFLAIARDITERKRWEENVQKQLRRLDALHTIDQAITSGLDLTFTLNVLLAQTKSQLHVDAVDVLFLNEATQTFELAISSDIELGVGLRTTCTYEDGLAGRAASEHRAVNILDLVQAKDVLQRYETFNAGRFVCGFAAPIISRRQVRGVLEAFRRSPLNPDTEWMDFFEALARQAAIAIDNIDTFNRLQRSNVELATAYDTTLEGWARAIDLRTREMEGHTELVAALTVELAREFGVSDEESVHIRRGALLHDIGKMSVPDEIMHKPGSLTDTEWAIVRKHPVYAREMLGSIPYLARAIDIPYYHHEKWDGTGYPNGLTGEAIPLAARIFAVVDVCDALRSDRSYRTAWSPEKTLAYLTEQSGKHFDPRVVKAFSKIIDHRNG